MPMFASDMESKNVELFQEWFEGWKDFVILNFIQWAKDQYDTFVSLVGIPE